MKWCRNKIKIHALILFIFITIYFYPVCYWDLNVINLEIFFLYLITLCFLLMTFLLCRWGNVKSQMFIVCYSISICQSVTFNLYGKFNESPFLDPSGVVKVYITVKGENSRWAVMWGKVGFVKNGHFLPEPHRVASLEVILWGFTCRAASLVFSFPFTQLVF